MGGHFDIPKIESDIKTLEEKVNSEGFWNDVDSANKTNIELSNLKKILENYNKVLEDTNYYKEFLSIATEEELSTIEESINNITKEIDELEINTLLNKEYDKCNCYLEIHPGAGGTESCDWASMLLRMYEKYCDKKGYKYEVLEEQKGDEAGIKSALIYIKGLYAYGYLKCERGIHRLVRISPFDSNKRRHTSFASVTVIPEIDTDINIDIKESDLKIDVYHSSGAGGQSVNTSNSAVRITHIPTGTVVTCQNERSQTQNKEQAMKVLMSRLYQMEMDKKQSELDEIKGTSTNIDFGSQIRSYVLEPYTLVKDARSNFETHQAMKVLDGDIEDLITSVLRKESIHE